jgi:hypothetical protein
VPSTRASWPTTTDFCVKHSQRTVVRKSTSRGDAFFVAFTRSLSCGQHDVRELRGKRISRLELDTRVRRVGADGDGDRVADVLERFVGSDPRSRNSTPLAAARRLAVYRQLLLDAGLLVG